MSVDIFRERITLRGVEGDMRTIPLAEFKRETAGGFGPGSFSFDNWRFWVDGVHGCVYLLFLSAPFDKSGAVFCCCLVRSLAEDYATTPHDSATLRT